MTSATLGPAAEAVVRAAFRAMEERRWKMSPRACTRRRSRDSGPGRSSWPGTPSDTGGVGRGAA